MRTIIAGSRTLGWQDLEAAMQHHRFPISEVVCGCAPGIDRCGYQLARDNDAPVVFFPAWADQFAWAVEHRKPDEDIYYPRKTKGIAGGYSGNSRSFGHQRNHQMALYAEACLLVWDGSSPGSRGMKEFAEREGLVLTVYKVPITQDRLFRK